MGKFEIFEGKGGQFYFPLKAENGETVAASQGYTTKPSAEHGIAAIWQPEEQLMFALLLEQHRYQHSFFFRSQVHFAGEARSSH